jgi:hypothetical protein
MSAPRWNRIWLRAAGIVHQLLSQHANLLGRIDAQSNLISANAADGYRCAKSNLGRLFNIGMNKTGRVTAVGRIDGHDHRTLPEAYNGDANITNQNGLIEPPGKH